MEKLFSRLPGWMVSSLLGAVIGIAIGVGSVLRARSDLRPGETLGYGQNVTMGLIAGTVGGLVYWATHPMRVQGGWRFFCAWILIGLIGSGAALIPGFIYEPSPVLFLMWMFLGVGGGIGLGITEREIRK